MDVREVTACPPRARAGLLLSSQFPVNYFSISDVEQFFPEFAAEYAGFDKALAGTGKFWRFNRIHDYAGKARRPCLPPPYPSRVRVVPASVQWPCNGRSPKSNHAGKARRRRRARPPLSRARSGLPACACRRACDARPRARRARARKTCQTYPWRWTGSTGEHVGCGVSADALHGRDLQACLCWPRIGLAASMNRNLFLTSSLLPSPLLLHVVVCTRFRMQDPDSYLPLLQHALLHTAWAAH